MTSTSPMEESRGKAVHCGTTGSWDSGRDLGTTYEESRGKAYIVGQREAGDSGV